jgi:hypothetical protein
MGRAASNVVSFEESWKSKVSEMGLTQLMEALPELENFLLEDVGWRRVSAETEFEFSNLGLLEIIRFSRFMFLKNPLINHAINVQSNYTWGRGATFTADGSVGEVVQGILEDPKNLVSFTSHQQQMLQDIQQAVDGNLLISMFTNPSTGRVILRIIPLEEVLETGDIIRNPNDRYDVWYYKRAWVEQSFDVQTGESRPENRVAYYPDWRYDPIEKPSSIAGKPVFWDAPVYHIKTGGLASMLWGVPEMYSALDWARAVKEDMEAYMAFRKALMRYSWLLTVKGGKRGVSAARSRLETTSTLESPSEGNPPAGPAATFIRDLSGADLAPIRTSGAAPSPDEGRRVGLMVSAGTGIPETILFGDADVGNLATAETLDRPTELQMANRQQLWADVYRDILGYCIRANILAPSGRLDGTIEEDEFGRQLVTVAETDDNGDPISVEVKAQFPDILQRSEVTRVQAIIDAATLLGRQTAGTMPDKVLVEQLLRALNIENVAEIMEDLFPDGAVDLEVNSVVVAGDMNAEPGTANFSDNARRLNQPRRVQGDADANPFEGQSEQDLNEALSDFRLAVAEVLRPAPRTS